MLGGRLKLWLQGIVLGTGLTGALLGQTGTPVTPPPVPAAAPPPPTAAPVPVSPSPAPGFGLPGLPVLGAKPKLSPLSPVPRWKDLQPYDGVLTRAEFEAALTNVYSAGPSKFPLPWTITDEAVMIDTTPGQLPLRIAFRTASAAAKPVVRYWRTAGEMRPLEPGMSPLRNVHIALDPGHIGGAYAPLEERWLSMNPGEAVMEGRLVLQVAQLLKTRLEALGARVSMVRDSEAPLTKATPETLKADALAVLQDAGIAAPKETYSDPKDESRILTVQWQAEKLFYRVSEIRARAQRVNEELRPDLVLCLHLNAEAWGDPQKPSFVDKNHLHLLLNGCYSADELQYEDVRFEMLHRLLNRTEVQELAMAGPMASAMASATHLPPYIYDTPNARRVSGSPYVYARNLLANRLYQCPVLYFEPYVMNHGETYRRLLLGHYLGRTLLDGHLVTSPLEDYARGVQKGLVDYFILARKGAR